MNKDILALIAAAIGFGVGAALTNNLKNKEIISIEHNNAMLNEKIRSDSFSFGWDHGAHFGRFEEMLANLSKNKKTDPTT